MRLAVIPARGGSKRIPRKNVRPFRGRPLIAWAIESARNCGLFDRIVVSTDDEEIAAAACQAGAEVPFIRPAALSDDITPTLPVIAHAIQEVDRDRAFDDVCCIYPAAVFVTSDDYVSAARLLADPGVDYVFTATSFPFPIQRALRRLGNGGCEMFWPEHRTTRSQDLPEAFHDAGQFYFGRREAWVDGRPFFGPGSRMHLLPRHRAQDIDTAEDWTHAEMLHRLVSGAGE